MIILVEGCKTEEYCGLDDANKLFSVKAIGSPQSLLRWFRESTICAALYGVLAVSSIIVFTLTFKKPAFFTMYTQLFILTGSISETVIWTNTAVSKRDNPLFLPAISAQFFSCVHLIFAMKYLLASIRIPLQADFEAKLDEEEKKLEADDSEEETDTIDSV